MKHLAQINPPESGKPESAEDFEQTLLHLVTLAQAADSLMMNVRDDQATVEAKIVVELVSTAAMDIYRRFCSAHAARSQAF